MHSARDGTGANVEPSRSIEQNFFHQKEKNRSLTDKIFILRSHRCGAVTLGACDAVRGDPMHDIGATFDHNPCLDSEKIGALRK